MIDVKGKSVFLSGPMTGVKHNNVAAFADAHAMLKLAGAAYVYDPACEWLQYDDGERTYVYWMRRSLEELTSEENGELIYDILVSLPEWRDSDDAKIERMVAGACGIEVCELADVVGGGA